MSGGKVDREQIRRDLAEQDRRDRVTDPANNDAARVRVFLKAWAEPEIRDAFDRLAAAAERADVLGADEVCACLHETGERKVRIYERCERCGAFMPSDALLVAQQERDKENYWRRFWEQRATRLEQVPDRERAAYTQTVKNMAKERERAEATNTRLRDGITKAQRQFIRGNYTGGRAALADALAQDAEQENA